MKQAVLAVREKKNFLNIEQALLDNQFSIQWTDSGKTTLDLFSDASTTIDLLIADEALEDIKGKDLVEKIITQSPMTNCAAASTLPHKEFHDAFEGYGVLMSLPLKPGSKDSEELISCLKKIHVITD